MRWLARAALIVALIVVLGFGYLVVAPPDLIRVGANYTAKMVCSNVFLAGRDAQQVLAIDVQAPGHPLLRLMRIDVDADAGTVRAGLFGIIGGGMAVHRPGYGCASLPDGDRTQLADVEAPQTMPAPDAQAQWPDGNRIAPLVNEALDAVLNDADLVGVGMRAVIIVKDGRIIAERYGDGFGPQTPLVGWSVAKTVTGALIGRAVRQNLIQLDQPPGFEGWDTDDRAQITLADMMGMTPDLEWNEGYGSVSDVTRMLFLEPDMAGFVAAKPRDAETVEGVGASFLYSSGTTVLLSRAWQDAFDDRQQAAAYPRQALFDPLGMTSAIMEMDATGTFVGSSYVYATARDWARFGLFMAQRGVWNGRSLLPVGFVDWMITPHPASNGRYGNGQIWLEPAGAWMEGPNPQLPQDGFYMNGHDGQSISVIPSQGLVVVRLGLTPTDQGYKVAHLVQAVIDALQ